MIWKSDLGDEGWREVGGGGDDNGGEMSASEASSWRARMCGESRLF